LKDQRIRASRNCHLASKSRALLQRSLALLAIRSMSRHSCVISRLSTRTSMSSKQPELVSCIYMSVRFGESNGLYSLNGLELEPCSDIFQVFIVLDLLPLYRLELQLSEVEEKISHFAAFQRENNGTAAKLRTTTRRGLWWHSEVVDALQHFQALREDIKARIVEARQRPRKHTGVAFVVFRTSFACRRYVGMRGFVARALLTVILTLRSFLLAIVTITLGSNASRV